MKLDMVLTFGPNPYCRDDWTNSCASSWTDEIGAGIRAWIFPGMKNREIGFVFSEGKTLKKEPLSIILLHFIYVKKYLHLQEQIRYTYLII